MAAISIYAYKQVLPKTDLPKSWIARPKKAAKFDTKPFEEYFPSPRPTYKATSRPVSEDDKEFLYNKLSHTGVQCPLKWICGPEPQLPEIDFLAPSLIEDLLDCFITDKEAFIEKCKVSPAQVKWLANKTIQQRHSQMWGQYRRLRLTGSNFGHVIDACQRKETKNCPIPSSLLKKLRGEYSLGTKDAIMWGQMHEDVAIKQYSFITGNVVEPAGLHLFPCGFLGSSPDGIISEASATVKGCGVLEVECPWKYNDMTVEQMIASELGDKDERKTFYLTNHRQLNQKHQTFLC